MADKLILSPSDVPPQPIDYNALPLDYRNRVEDCDCRIAAHEMRAMMLRKAKSWTGFSLFFDVSCIACGAFFFHESWRRANAEISFLRSVTGHPLLLRAATPFPFFSSLLVLVGLCCVPGDLVARSATKLHLQDEQRSVTRLEGIRQHIAAEAAQSKGNGKDIAIK